MENSANVADQDGFAARLREVVKAYGRTSELARRLDRSEGALRKWLGGKTEPTVGDLRRICAVTETNVDWLVTGRGSRLGGLRVFEEVAARPSVRTPFNYRLHAELSAAIDEEASALSLDIPRLKRSSMIGMLYDQFEQAGKMDREVVARMVRLTE